jgi:FtsZ-binding cell division protein ZapB
LIRRNDELSLLYEKIKIQTSTLNKGEIQYRERVEDIRVLRLEIKKLRREKAMLQTETQNVDGLRGEVFKLQRECLKERTRVKVLEGSFYINFRGIRIPNEYTQMEKISRFRSKYI